MQTLAMPTDYDHGIMAIGFSLLFHIRDFGKMSINDVFVCGFTLQRPLDQYIV